MITGDVLKPAEARLIGAIAETGNATQEELATRLKISPRYVRILLARESVRRALDDAARAGLRDAAAVLGRGAARAARSLVAMSAGEIAPTAARVQACRAVLENAYRISDAVEFERRLAALEQTRAAAWRGQPQ